ncbi:hypothetical protein [Natronomonas amylolytica]|uniref:hypothetical protein n=1 Tax=Natronomonas amylolytica TaxID=3108498 RepID=UPI0030080DEC
MEDIPQPPTEPYSIGDRVWVYVSSGDPDSQYHGRVCEVVDILSDDLDIETGRATDAYSYIVEDMETKEELPVSFRHQDLVPDNRG